VARRPIGVKAILLATAALLALTLPSCGDEDPDATAKDEPAATLSLDDLHGRTFASVQVAGHRLVDDTQIRLGFENDQLSADAGCNHLFGTVAVDGDTLTASDIGGTEMGCPDGRNDQDAWVAEFLGAGPTAVLDGDTLTLTQGDVVIELVELDVPEQPTGDPEQPTSNQG
jgi:heat shock protein HslJ